MSDPNQDIVHRLLHWAYTICTFNKAQVARDAAAEITRLRTELAAAKKRIDELENPIRNPLSSALELEEALRHMKQRGGGA